MKPAAILLALPLAACMTTPVAPPRDGVALTARLHGNNEVPPVATDGSGSFEGSLDTDTNELCYEMVVSGVGAPRAAHIHFGAAGTNGGVAVPLEAPAVGMSKGCATLEADLAVGILANPQGYYVNIHNTANPAGAIRGQLSIR